ncbi:hypothetical protein IQ07DRAFT_560794 [Pyrenochaeta sp. DS3sAY3a]|nr:hypothetical protein IQ07DRAFT_560794 [Pyrenochaeta sp. DS3sAY3a]
MVYNWDDKEAECYRLYVEERRSLDEVIAYWEQRGFTPSKRGFQTQFKRWDFPSKQNPAHKNPALITRVHTLWEQNFTQKDMIETLQNEGFPITDRELIRLRHRLKLLLRESVPRPKRKAAVGDTNGTTSGDGRVQKKKPKKKAPKVIPGKGLINQLANAIVGEDSESEEDEEEDEEREPNFAQDQLREEPAEEIPQTESTTIPAAEVPGLSQEEILRKQLRHEQLQLESDEKWRSRKRRRRTRGWAGLPADNPGEPPRFPSETTIDEAKAYLVLDNKMYREIRETFLELCKDQGITKKTIAGPEKWAQIVQKLIRENTHLSEVFQEEPEVLENNDALYRPKGQKALSLDVICIDVTKRLRTLETRMSLADAKNLLSLNPEQTRQLRSAFVARLKADHFINKHEAGEQHWEELKQAWINESEPLARALSHGQADPQHAQRVRAIEVLARDVMKRVRQERTTKDPTQKKQVHQGPGPGPAPPIQVPHSAISQTSRQTQNTTNPTTAAQTQPQTTFPPLSSLSAPSDLQIDPSLLLAASDAAILPASAYHTSDPPSQPHPQPQPHDPYRQPQHTPHSQYQQYYPASQTPSVPLPVYFRLHPHSSTPFPAKTVWLSILHSHSIAELRALAMREHPGTTVQKLEGLISYRGQGQGQGQEREVVVEVGDDEELGAYLGHVRATAGEGGSGQGKATFVVWLELGGVGGYA